MEHYSLLTTIKELAYTALTESNSQYINAYLVSILALCEQEIKNLDDEFEAMHDQEV